MYTLFGVAVACDFPLPGLPESPKRKADIRIVLGTGSPNETGYDWFHAWRESDGELVLACARNSGGHGPPNYLLRFPELADFVLTGDHVRCYPQPDCRGDSLRHLLLDQVIPRLWAHRGHLVLHASAVRLPGGHVIAFLGESGWGKSTLAAALQARGSSLISDDSISLKTTAGGVELVPSYTGLRLNDDSIATLGLEGEDWTSVAHYSDKRRFEPATDDHSQYYKLDSLYVMDEPCPSIVSLSINPLSGAELITTLIKRSFVLDTRDKQCAARQLHDASAVVRSTPQIRSLTYSREYQQLPALCEALMAESTR